MDKSYVTLQKKKSAINALKTASKRAFDKRQKQQVIWLEIRLQKILQDPSEDPVKSAQPTEMPKKKYIPPEKWQQIFDELYYIYIKNMNGVPEDHKFAEQN